jgi:hypothetical protein
LEGISDGELIEFEGPAAEENIKKYVENIGVELVQ